jgi:outer membrane receptor protein involved in Fe transport
LVEGENVTLTNWFTVQNLSPSRTERAQEGWREQTQSVFGSAEIGYKGAYYLTLTARNDWPSQLAGPMSEVSSYFYPSVGASVVLSEVLDLPRQISYMKARASFASVGSPFQRYIANPRHSWLNGLWQNRTDMPTYNLKPERTNSWEFGLTTRFMSHWNLDVSYYNTKTRNQTFSIQLPSSSIYSSMYVQTGAIRNSGVELALGYNNTWGKFGWETNYTLSANRNKVLKVSTTVNNPSTGEKIEVQHLDFKPMGYVHFLVKDGGSMGDLYSSSDFRRDSNNNIYVDENGGITATDLKLEEFVKLGSVLPKANMAWRNSFSYGNITAGFMVSARLGGIVYSRTQGVLDFYGVSEDSAAARDLGYVEINGGDRVSPHTWFKAVGNSRDIPQYYTYSATNVRLSEASIGYNVPRKWLGNVCDIQVSVVGRNLWMIYNKAPYDPESVARVDNFYQGVDYFMMPSLRNIGFNLRVKF